MKLLQHWQEVYREALELCNAIDRIPDECHCGNGDDHLGGRCVCCRAHAPGAPEHDSGLSCTEILSTLGVAVALLCEDLGAVALGAQKAPDLRGTLEVRQRIYLAAGDLEKLGETLRRISDSVAGFRSTCAVAEMKGIKRHGAALRAHCDRLNTEIQGID